MDTLIGEEDFLAKYVTWALWILAVIVCAATATGLIESYNGLYIWFALHGITGFWADYAPLMVDSFTIIGELAIFAGIARHWHWPSRILPWASAMIGIGASIAGNVGDKIGHPLSWELTAAIPPLAGAFGIVIGLGVLKRVARDHAERKARKQAKDVTDAQVQASANYIKNVYGGDQYGNTWLPNIPFAPYEPVAGPSIETMERVQEQLTEREKQGPPSPLPVIPTENPKVLADFVQPTATATTAVPEEISRSEARRRLSDTRFGRQIIDPQGLDVTETGAQPFTPEDVLNYKPGN